jgi:ATP-dependent helicase/nuclease subunit B
MSFWRIPAGINFAEAVAAELLQRARESTNPLELTDTLLLLPTRRACRTMRTAFLRQSDGQSLLLPRLYALGDLDADELMLTDTDLTIPPALPPLRRLLHLARLIRSYNAEWTHAQAISMARALAKLLDDMTLEGVSPDKLDTLLQDEIADLSEHWKQTLNFITPVVAGWPEILRIEGALDASDRLNLLLAAQTEIWRKSPPAYPVIVAGSQGTIPAIANLIQTVSQLPKGEIILPSLPAASEMVSFAEHVDDTHPLFAISQLLAQCDRELGDSQIKLWPVHGQIIEPQEQDLRHRRHLLHMALLPAKTTQVWSALTPSDKERITAGAQGMALLECQSEQEEAEVIAALLRGALEGEKRKTAMLVTPSRDLGRRVAAELERWDIHISDSAGAPLSKTPPAMFMRAVLDFAASPSPARLLSLLKHPLAGTGVSILQCRRNARQLELQILRGLPADTIRSLGDLLDIVEQTNPLHDWLSSIQTMLAPLAHLMTNQNVTQVSFTDLVTTLVLCLERIGTTDDRDGAARLWSGEAGRALAEWVADILNITADYPALPVQEAPSALLALMVGVNIHLNRGQHPRLSILGPMEAQLQQADLVILGGLNEGVWPAPPEPDPWMSRPMRRKLGLKPTEQRIGQQAHDFYSLACAPAVVLTRAVRSGGTPTVPARWWQRLDVLLDAANVTSCLMQGAAYLQLARAIDDTNGMHQPAPQPQPCPPLKIRPRNYAVTDIEKLQRDPYSVYARKILQLKPLDPLEAEITPALLGMMYHDIATDFVRSCSDELLQDEQAAIAHFLSHAEIHLRNHHLIAQKMLLWPTLQKIAANFIRLEQKHRTMIGQIGIQEQWGSAELATTAGHIQLSAKADRIDILKDGRLILIDYKSGTLPSATERKNGNSLQLPLEALIAREGNYTGLPKISETSALQFWPLKGSTQPKDQSAEDFVSTTMTKETSLQELVTQSEAILQDLMTLYLEKGAPYTAEPVRDKSNAYNDYRHLSRYEEWAQQRNMTDDQDLIDLLNDDLSDEEIEDGEGDYAA